MANDDPRRRRAEQIRELVLGQLGNGWGATQLQIWSAIRARLPGSELRAREVAHALDVLRRAGSVRYTGRYWEAV